MNLKFHDGHGREVRVTDSTAFIEMIRAKRIAQDTLIFDEDTRLWKPAGDYAEYRTAISEIESAAAPSYGAPVLSGLASFGEPADDERGKAWPLTLGVALLLAALTVTALTLIQFSFDPIQAAGHLLVVVAGAFVAAIISLLAWLLLLRNRKDMGLLFFSCCFFAVAIGYYALTASQVQSNRRAVEDTSAAMSEFLNDDGAAPQLDPAQYGSRGPFVRVLVEYLGQVRSDFTEMNTEIESLRLSDLLARPSLQDLAHIDVARERVQSLYQILDRYQERFNRRQEELPRKVAASGMSETESRSFVAGFDESRITGEREIAEFFEIERESAAKLDETLSFLAGRQHRYRFVADEIQFSSVKDLQHYQQLMSDIALLGQQENAWRVRSRANAQRGIDEFKKLAR